MKKDKNEIVTVEEFVRYLRENFKESDRLCFFDEGGAWCEIVHVLKDMIGKTMFISAKSKMDGELKRYPDTKDVTTEEYRLVADELENSVVIY